MRIEASIKALSQLTQNGYTVGSLNWKAPTEFRSVTDVQSGHQKFSLLVGSQNSPSSGDGFEFDNKNGQTVLSLSTLADIPLSSHREIPDTVTVKEVCLNKERTGEWYGSFAVEGKEEPTNPDNPDRCVGIDVGILKYAHDTDGRAVGSLDLQDERERLKREQRSLSRKQHDSNNWENQRLRVAKCHQRLKRKRHDFLHTLSNYDATEYDVVAVEELDVKSMFEMDRDANAAINILSRGFEQRGVGHSDGPPVETALPLFTSSGASDVVDGKCVLETGSPTLNERPVQAVSE